MSNYSLSRVLSPFRVQTKFEENSLPARSNAVSIRYREIMVFCIVLGDNTEAAFPVKLPSDKKVGELRELIKKINSISFANIDAKDLILWQVDISDDDVGRMNILNTKPPSDINIEELEGKVMSSRKEINFYFPEDPANEHIHIIIVRPQPPTTTGKRRWDLYDGDEDQDRKKSKLTDLEKILTSAKKLMEDIRKLPEDRNVYSNPETFILLPFPFLGDDKPVERFYINDDDKYLYMGRKAFDKVLNIIYELKYGNGYKKFFIYGTMGYGKSYILATIVCFLLRTGKRVLYLPDCRQLAMDLIDYVKSALYLAYENDSDKISKIHDCKTVDEIVKFCKEEEPLYIVVDQINVLDGYNNTEINESIKQRTIEFLSQMTTKHYYIKSSSANNTSALRLKSKQTNEKKIELYGGFDEMSQWWMQNRENLPSMDDEQKKKIVYITGQNPLFLSFLLGSKKNFKGALEHLKQMLIEKIETPMTNFSEIIRRENKKWDFHVDLMSLCLTNGYAPSGYGINDYDHRFFYIDKNKRCHYTSGFVRDCMADYLFEKGRLEVFATSSWIQCIKEFKNNPSVKGFMVEKACIASIYKNGLMVNAKNFKPDEYKFFARVDEINFTLNEGLCTIHLPRYWNQKSIDVLLTLYTKNVSKLYIAPILITLNKDSHSDSEASFFSDIWPILKLKVPGTLEVEIIFIWITRENDVDYVKEEAWKKLRGRNIEINPEYTRIVKSFKNINIDLENSLSC